MKSVRQIKQNYFRIYKLGEQMGHWQQLEKLGLNSVKSVPIFLPLLTMYSFDSLNRNIFYIASIIFIITEAEEK